MVRRRPRSTPLDSSAASDVYKRQGEVDGTPIFSEKGMIASCRLARSVADSDIGVYDSCLSAPKVLPTRGSVSYTHLRANETSQDLVCRLLLEKKQRPINNYW